MKEVNNVSILQEVFQRKRKYRDSRGIDLCFGNINFFVLGDKKADLSQTQDNDTVKTKT